MVLLPAERQSSLQLCSIPGKQVAPNTLSRYCPTSQRASIPPATTGTGDTGVMEGNVRLTTVVSGPGTGPIFGLNASALHYGGVS